MLVVFVWFFSPFRCCYVVYCVAARRRCVVHDDGQHLECSRGRVHNENDDDTSRSIMGIKCCDDGIQ